MRGPVCDMETAKLRMNEELNFSSLINSLFSYLKSLMEADVILFLVSLICALVNATSFSSGLRRSKICLMFAKMFELKRVVIAGPTPLCNFYVISSFFVVFLCLWTFLRIFQNSCLYGFSSLWTKISMFMIPAITMINFFALLFGNQAFCDSFDVHKFCSSELLHNTDFKTFTPKYLDAYSYFDISRVSLIASILLCISWTAAIIFHHKKQRRRLTLL